MHGLLSEVPWGRPSNLEGMLARGVAAQPLSARRFETEKPTPRCLRPEQVDFGAEYDGLIPLDDQDHWDALDDRLSVGDSVQAVVFRLRDPILFRYPVQLVPVDAELAAVLPDPAAHMPTMDLRDITM